MSENVVHQIGDGQSISATQQFVWNVFTSSVGKDLMENWAMEGTQQNAHVRTR